MANLRLRDRDAIQTKEGIIFRVLGYSHPQDAYICDAEYASSKIFQSIDPRAPRTGKSELYYKFYNNEGLKLITKKYQQFLISHEMLGLKVVGAPKNTISQARKPSDRLQELLKTEPTDSLLTTMKKVLRFVSHQSGVSTHSFGVFGSMLHGFHHPKYSDIDFIIYGKPENTKLHNTLKSLYADSASGLSNEFESCDIMKGKNWYFKNFDIADFIWHQRRKMIYGVYHDRKATSRVIKVEFEPVKDWGEIKNEYNPNTRILQKGWVKLRAKVTKDDDGPFIPSIYSIETMDILSGPKEAFEAKRIFSYMEEFRGQARCGDTVIVEGNLEEVQSPNSRFLQVTLTYCPRYYEQVLRVLH